jgi:sigma-B regulation protein RsbU (phosphoserine phosphatase)
VGISLSIKGPDGQTRQVDFDKDKVTLGQGVHCDVSLSDPEVEEEQCVVVAQPDGVEVINIGDTPGVLVNGKPTTRAHIKPGDEVWIGGTVFGVLLAEEDVVSFTEADSTVREELAARKEPTKTLAEPAPREERFRLLDQVQHLIASIGTNENVFERILDTMFSSAPVRRGFIALLDKDAGASGELRVKAQRRSEQGASGDKIEVSRTLVGKVLQTGKAVLTSDAEADADFSAALSIHRLRIKAAICVPLVVEGHVIGILYGDNREQPGSLTKEHLSILTALASIAAIAVEKFRLLAEAEAKQKFEQALAIARTIQLNFLPSGPPEVPGLDVWGKSVSCDETGGDYYDFFPMRDGSIKVVIADVTGHGVGPALLMATGRAALRVLIDSEPSLEQMMFRLNNRIGEDVTDGRFITMFAGHIDAKDGAFTHVGAGHTPPIWFRRKDGSTHLVTSNGPPLGILPGIEFRAGTKLPVAKGDVILFTTDGIMEADRPDGEQFGMERLKKVLAAHAGASAKEIVAAVSEAVNEFAEGRPLRDDATLVAAKLV